MEDNISLSSIYALIADNISEFETCTRYQQYYEQPGDSTPLTLEDLCSNCRDIDFELFNGWPSDDGWEISISQAPDPSCPLCRFLELAIPSLTPGLGGRSDRLRLALHPRYLPDGRDRWPILRIDDEVGPADWGPLQFVVGRCNENDSPGTQIVSPRRIQPDRIDYQLLKGWVSHCQQNENRWGSCKIRPLEPDIPLRVIDCSSALPTLVAYPHAGDSDYVALSYVWGSTAVTQDAVLDSPLPGPLPKVISDAMVVTKEMGCRYLWVDRYCIPQTGGDPQLRSRLLEMMGRIYECAKFTIIAAAGSGPDWGLPGVTTTPRHPPPMISILVDDDCYQMAYMPQPKEIIRNSKWATRAWTHQEGILSTRRLVFTSYFIYFQCREGMRLETLNSRPLRAIDNVVKPVFPINSRIDSGFLSSAPIASHIEQYIPRELTRPEDALAAFRGILHHYRTWVPSVLNLCGMPVVRHETLLDLADRERTTETPLSDLAVALSWVLFPRGQPNRPSLEMERRPGRFPSWSWIGWKFREAPTLFLDCFNPTYGLMSSFNDVWNTSVVYTSYLENAWVDFEDGTVYKWPDSSPVSSPESSSDLAPADESYTVCMRSDLPPPEMAAALLKSEEYGQVRGLRLEGWRFDVTAQPKSLDNNGGFGYFLSLPADFIPSSSQPSAEGDDNQGGNFWVGTMLLEPASFTLFLLRSRRRRVYFGTDGRGWSSNLELLFLLLKQVPGPQESATAVFERLDCLGVDFAGDFHQIDEDTVLLGNQLLERTTITLV